MMVYDEDIRISNPKRYELGVASIRFVVVGSHVVYDLAASKYCFGADDGVFAKGYVAKLHHLTCYLHIPSGREIDMLIATGMTYFFCQIERIIWEYDSAISAKDFLCSDDIWSLALYQGNDLPRQTTHPHIELQ